MMKGIIAYVLAIMIKTIIIQVINSSSNDKVDTGSKK